jgi:hypothetical protein
MLVSEFITAVRRQGKITSDTTDAEILSTGDMEIQGSLIPLVRLSHQEYFVAESQVASVSGRVRLPNRSVLGAVRHVQLISGNRAIKLPMVALEDDYLGSGAGVPESWYFDGGAIVLLPRGTDATVRLRYYLRPPKMVVETDTRVAAITAVSLSGTDYNLTLFNSLGALAPIDVIGAGGSHALVALDALASGTTAQPIPSTNVLSPIAVGDYVVPSGFSAVVPVPEELFAALVHQVAYVVLRSLGYDNEAQAQQALAGAAIQQGQAILAPRSEGNPKRLRGGLSQALGRGLGWRR